MNEIIKAFEAAVDETVLVTLTREQLNELATILDKVK
jgi:hypothetical protein